MQVSPYHAPCHAPCCPCDVMQNNATQHNTIAVKEGCSEHQPMPYHAMQHNTTQHHCLLLAYCLLLTAHCSLLLIAAHCCSLPTAHYALRCTVFTHHYFASYHQCLLCTNCYLTPTIYYLSLITTAGRDINVPLCRQLSSGIGPQRPKRQDGQRQYPRQVSEPKLLSSEGRGCSGCQYPRQVSEP